MAELFSYNTAEELRSSSVSATKRTPPSPDAPALPPKPRPDWVKYAQVVKKKGEWSDFTETDEIADFTRWRIDGEVDQFVDRDLAQVIADIKDHLQELELSRCNHLTSKGLGKLVDARKMTTLTIRECSQFDDKMVESLFLKITNNAPIPLLEGISEELNDLSRSSITYLRIFQCPISDVSLEYLPKGLTHLYLDNCKGITDQGMPVMASRLSELKHLSIKYTGVTFAGIPDLFGLKWSSRVVTAGTTANLVQKSDSPLPKLSKLEINGCSMKGRRGNFSRKLEEGLKKYYENVKVTGIEP